MKKKVVTAFMMAALGSSLVFTQAVMAADTTAKTETSENADKDSTESEDKDVAEDADKADEEKEDLKTIGEKPEEDTEGVFSVKLKNLTGKVITGVTVKNEKDEEYPDNFLKEDKFEADEERVLWFDPSAKDKADEENKDSSNDTKEITDTEETKTEDAKTDEKAEGEDKDDAEKEIPKYNIQLTFEDGTTAEIHTFPFGDTEEAELYLEGEVAYLVFDSISQKKEYNTLETEKALAPKPTEQLHRQLLKQLRVMITVVITAMTMIIVMIMITVMIMIMVMMIPVIMMVLMMVVPMTVETDVWMMGY